MKSTTPYIGFINLGYLQGVEWQIDNLGLLGLPKTELDSVHSPNQTSFYS